jgi:hypothetical protein
VSDSQLPAVHGTAISYICLRKHAKKGGYVQASCQDGKITFAGDGFSPCFKMGEEVQFIYS